MSPITHVTPAAAPTLLVVGDADELLPPQQSVQMARRLRAAGVPSELVISKGSGHDDATVRTHLPQALAWFDKYLLKTK